MIGAPLKANRFPPYAAIEPSLVAVLLAIVDPRTVTFAPCVDMTAAAVHSGPQSPVLMDVLLEMVEFKIDTLVEAP